LHKQSEDYIFLSTKSETSPSIKLAYVKPFLQTSLSLMA